MQRNFEYRMLYGALVVTLWTCYGTLQKFVILLVLTPTLNPIINPIIIIIIKKLSITKIKFKFNLIYFKFNYYDYYYPDTSTTRTTYPIYGTGWLGGQGIGLVIKRS